MPEDIARPSELDLRGQEVEDVPASRLQWRSVEIDALRRVKYAITALRGTLVGLIVWNLNVDDELRQHLSHVYAAYTSNDIDSDGEWIRKSAETILWAPYAIFCAASLGLIWLLRKRCRLLLTAQPSDERAIRSDLSMGFFVTGLVGFLVNFFYWPDSSVWMSYWTPGMLSGIGAITAIFYSWTSANWGYHEPVKAVGRGVSRARVDPDQ
ncbi:hypothetical protein [Mycolicibacter icosiumassiliensis]|uniref:hypothetical protein n=1 Tax=Mycolicibacter icosiumassiliensis TaxID=1792835 RepID=UPI00082A4A45|nr:hypothetical protein [Mycolicibacter icosiumassiliensis]